VRVRNFRKSPLEGGNLGRYKEDKNKSPKIKMYCQPVTLMNRFMQKMKNATNSTKPNSTGYARLPGLVIKTGGSSKLEQGMCLIHFQTFLSIFSKI
jgi:hypothetical protein